MTISLCLLTTLSFAKTTLYYKVKGKNADFSFSLSTVSYKGQRVILSEGTSYLKYGIFYKGGFNFKGYSTLNGDMILNTKCNWKTKITKSECVRVKFNGDDTFAYYKHKSTDLSLNENFLERSQTKTLKMSEIQPGIPKHATIFDASSLIAFTPMLNLTRGKNNSKIIYTNYKEKISKSKIWIESQTGNIQTIKVTPIYPSADEFKTLIVKIYFDTKRKLVTSFIQKVPVLGNITVELKNVTKTD